jgi:hypothetical protein
LIRRKRVEKSLNPPTLFMRVIHAEMIEVNDSSGRHRWVTSVLSLPGLSASMIESQSLKNSSSLGSRISPALMRVERSNFSSDSHRFAVSRKAQLVPLPFALRFLCFFFRFSLFHEEAILMGRERKKKL